MIPDRLYAVNHQIQRRTYGWKKKEKEKEVMLNFFLGFFVGAIVGVIALVCVAVAYNKNHPDD